jgi:hypothetical protein
MSRRGAFEALHTSRHHRPAEVLDRDALDERFA